MKNRILLGSVILLSLMSIAAWQTENIPWDIRVNCGEVPNFTTIEKFGECAEIDTGTTPSDVWDGAQVTGITGTELYTFTTTPQAYHISSTNAGDTQSVSIRGITQDAAGVWNEETVIMDLAGQTETPIVSGLGNSDAWVRVYRIINLGATSFAGNVYVYEDDTVSAGAPQTAAKVREVVIDGNNQTEMAIYTVPDTAVNEEGKRFRVKCAVFRGGYVGISRGGATAAAADFTWRARPYGGVFAVKGRVQAQNNGGGHYDYEYPTGGIKFEPKTDVLMRCEKVTANDTGVVGGFGIILRGH